MRNRIDHWCTVEPGNPNPRVNRSSGKLGEASFPTGTVDPRVGISLSPLNTNDGFSLSVMDARMDGLVQPVPLSIESTENRDARPFWMRAFTAHELFIDWFKSMPTCVTDLTCWS